MNDILRILFLDNPYLPEQVCAFCDQLPEFQQAEQDYKAFAEKLRTQLGYTEYAAFEEAFNWYLARCSHAYYLFGLGLRQEVLFALGQAGLRKP